MAKRPKVFHMASGLSSVVCGSEAAVLYYTRDWKRVTCNRCLSVLAQKKTSVRSANGAR